MVQTMVVVDAIFISGLMLLLPFTVQIRNYIFVRIESYLYLSLIFLCAAINIINPLIFESGLLPDLVDTISYFGIYFFLLLISTNAGPSVWFLEKKYWVNYTIFAVIFTSIIKILVYYDELSDSVLVVKTPFGELFRLYAGFVTIYAYAKSKLILDSFRTNLVKVSFQFWGVILIIIGVIRFIWYSLLSIDLIIEFISSDNYDLVNPISSQVTAVEFVVIFVMFFLSIFVPESLLVTHTQIQAVARLYGKIDNETFDERPIYSSKTIANYLRKLQYD